MPAIPKDYVNKVLFKKTFLLNTLKNVDFPLITVTKYVF